MYATFGTSIPDSMLPGSASHNPGGPAICMVVPVLPWRPASWQASTNNVWYMMYYSMLRAVIALYTETVFHGCKIFDTAARVSDFPVVIVSEYSSRFVQNTFLIDQQSSTCMTTLSENQAAAWDRRGTVMLPLLADGLDVRKVPFRSVLPVKRFR